MSDKYEAMKKRVSKFSISISLKRTFKVLAFAIVSVVLTVIREGACALGYKKKESICTMETEEPLEENYQSYYVDVNIQAAATTSTASVSPSTSVSASPSLEIPED